MRRHLQGHILLLLRIIMCACAAMESHLPDLPGQTRCEVASHGGSHPSLSLSCCDQRSVPVVVR